VIADMTTKLVIVFLGIVLVTFFLSIFELISSWKNYKAVLSLNNQALHVISAASIIKSFGFITVQLCFVALALTVVNAESRDLHWHHILFVISFMVAEIVICFLVLNELISRRKLEKIVESTLRG
jgi:general stress protein CsbA